MASGWYFGADNRMVVSTVEIAPDAAFISWPDRTL